MPFLPPNQQRQSTEGNSVNILILLIWCQSFLLIFDICDAVPFVICVMIFSAFGKILFFVDDDFLPHE